MDKLDRYINSICSKLKGRSEEITIVRQEMKNHLLQSIEELRKQGKSQDESIDIAINKFGQVEILKEVDASEGGGYVFYCVYYFKILLDMGQDT